MGRKCISGLLACCLLLFTLPGCWDARELNRRAIVSGIGIDHSDGGYEVSLQVIIADEISGKTGRGGTPTSVYHASGRSVVEAMRNVSREVPRLISTGQTRLIVISEEIAREGISGLVDFLDRDSDLRLSTKLYIAREGIKASDIVSALTPLGKITAYALVQKTDLAADELGANFAVEIDDVLRGLLSPGGGPVINGLNFAGSPEKAGDKGSLEKTKSAGVVVIDDMALFKGDKLVGWMNREECKGMVWMLNKMRKTVLLVKPEGDEEEITLEVFETSTSTKVDVSNPRHPMAVIKVKPQMSVREAGTEIDLRDSLALDKVEKAANVAIARKLESAVKKAQQMKSDIFGIAQQVERTNPKAWKRIGGQWEEIFPAIDVQYEVDSIIRNTQMRDRSYKYHFKKK
ncbi:spore germination protein KC [Fontibacillus phaseoli]|uniref:Spore germination protein KC n=1 Tax=Fontibacillus phaseoli TaxID=1416533 RepID=A0A369BCC0_9BACL|nr:Ger(x)C family spore germination protein [Fontibacillus phaseoli]RCX19192.1 spore germination protein KC [Fontibacillus phaseoli]